MDINKEELYVIITGVKMIAVSNGVEIRCERRNINDDYTGWMEDEIFVFSDNEIDKGYELFKNKKTQFISKTQTNIPAFGLKKKNSIINSTIEPEGEY